MKKLFRRLSYQLSLFGYFKQTCFKAYNIPDHIDKQTLLLQHQFIQNLLAQPRYADPKRLHRFEYQVFSQNGEDGTLTEIFRRVGITDRRFVEIGVSDGLENNTTCLLSQGWKGCWVDGDDSAVEKIGKTFWQPLRSGDLVARQSLITAENVAGILSDLKVAQEFDLLSLDIDRNTFYVWQALRGYRPRVVVIEYNSGYPPPMDWAVEYEPRLVYNCTSYNGASLSAYERLGHELGYALVGCELSGINAFFVRKDLCGDKFAAPFTAENHYEPPRYFLVRRDGLPRCFTDIRHPS